MIIRKSDLYDASIKADVLHICRSGAFSCVPTSKKFTVGSDSLMIRETAKYPTLQDSVSTLNSKVLDDTNKKTSCLEAERLFTLKRTEGASEQTARLLELRPLDRWDQNDVVWSKSAQTPQTNSQQGGGEVMICAPCSHLVRHEFLCVPKYARV